MATVVKIKKTKEDLLNEVEELKDIIKEKEKEIKALERYKSYSDAADEFRAMHMSFVNSGFTDDQAFDMTKQFMGIACDNIRVTLGIR